MKLITVIIIGVLTITSAIRVPTSWTSQDLQRNNNHKFRTNVRSENGIHARPYVSQINNKVNSRVKHQQKERHHSLERPEAKNEFKASAALGDWKPIFPVHLMQKDDSFYEEFKDRRVPAPMYRNYRDDSTHEPSSSHELPLEVPTKPIYPGEGEWAKRGRKHKPFISKHKFTQPDEHEDEKRPEGYEVFEKQHGLFEKQRQKFRGRINPLLKEETYEDDEDEDTQEFVPTRVYTQVRRTENEEHLPRLAEDPRLRELIKDSKIQTVYTEEGYEDLAYDHAGHEKSAEEDEGHSKFDQEVEKQRQKKARKFKPVDSDSEGSHHHVVKKPLSTKSFIKKEEIKTASLKDKDGGKAELEILSEIKVVETPKNQTETHKYVTIVPRTFTTETPVASESAINSVYRIHFRKRNKRFINDFPEIKAETDFIDKINHNLPKIAMKYEKPKYPYYNDPTINPYSPIRYAEDLENIPKKTQDDLAFYNQAEKVECAEVESNIDPIPSRVKAINEDPENAEGSSNPEIAKLPRLRNLGDKIDCFKVKYFGENPLDSPFFQEKELGPVLPLFKMPKKEYSKLKKSDVGNTRSYSIKIPVKAAVTQDDLNILSDVIEQFNKSRQIEKTTTARNAIQLEVADHTEASVISIITTPKYTIDLKPKHIYHQIELLSYLPTYGSSKSEETPTTIRSVKILEETPTTVRSAKILEETPTTVRSAKILEETPTTVRSAKSLEETTTVATPVEEATPESQALRHRHRQPRPPTTKPPPYQIFDINKYLPSNSFSLLNRIIRTSTLVPHHGVASEVHYKHEIKPSEQLNVFADVINNIKNSSKNSELISSSSNRITVTLNDLDNHRKSPVFETDLDGIEDMTRIYTTTKAPRGTIKYSSYKNKEHLFEESANRDKYENLELLKINKRLTTTTEPFATQTRISAPPVEEEPEEIEEETTVLGLMPPMPNHYKTIYSPKSVKPVTDETKMNLFYVLGMKPPSAKQKVLLYSDFKIRPHKSKHHYIPRRGRRSAQRPSYSEVSRNRNKPIDVDDDSEVVVQDDDDDYVPHRPKNYHYDEKTGRIVYDNVKKETEAPEEYIEVTEAPLPPPTRRNSLSAAPAPKFNNFTGPSFVDFVNKLKSNANYTEITDPPPTEKAEVEVTTTTTAKPVSTEPPEFLSILSKVKSDASYKEIKDKTTKKTTTTEAAVVEVDVEEETQLENVQNSPGGPQQVPNFQIFDINDYLPKVKNYTPRTSIDYSKYKTIERPNSGTRHNLSSRYSADEDGGTTKAPEEAKEKEIGEINPVMSESKHEDVEPSTTTTTTEAPVSRRVRTRPKSRGTRRPTKRVTTIAPSTASEEPVQVPDKPKRVFPRRRPTRIKVTTTELPDAIVEESTSGKVIRRRHQKSQEEVASTTEEAIAMLNKTKPTLKRGESRKIADVQVFQKYDGRKKHGGNLKKEEAEKGESKKADDVERLTDIVHKPSTYYTDVKLPKKINQLVEVKIDADQIAEEVENETEKEELVGDYEYEGLEEKTTTTTTKKPVFVKDPDKRMYYYAPI